MTETRKNTSISAVGIIPLLMVLGLFGIMMFEERKVTESMVSYVIHNPDGTQTYGSVVYDDRFGDIRPEVFSSRGTSKLRAGYHLISSNGTIEILNVRPYREYYTGGPLSKHKRRRLSYDK